MKIHCLDVLLGLDTSLNMKYIFFACLLFLLEKSCTIIKSHIMSTKNQQKIEKRKEKQMPGNVRFTITPELKRQIKKIIDERINEVHVTKEDFSELKAIVSDIAISLRELAEAQKRTELRVEEISKTQNELAEAQKRTEVRMGELAEAQKRTEEEVTKLAIGLNDTRVHLGGLSRSFGYAFENEAYRNLPKLLYDRYGYEVKERVVRAEVGGKEINFFGKAIKNGKEIYIVGESKVRLDEGQWRSEVFEYLQEKINAIREVYGDVPILPILVTHFATQGFIKEATQKGIIVIQSYEW
jgi:hypothetical protein